MKTAHSTNNTETLISDLKIENLKDASRPILLQIWRKMFHTDPPKKTSRRMLEHSAAYYVQSKQSGGLPQNIKLKLKRYSNSKTNVSNFPEIPDGTVFVREWNGSVHQVEAIDDKFKWKEQLYGSLSEIARSITGTRWSGPRFFGLRAQS